MIKGNIKVVKLLLQFNADVNEIDEQKNTPLHASGTLVETLDSAIHSSDDTIPIYIETKASVNQYKNVRIADMLIQKGSEPKAENNLGWNVLHLADKNNCEQLAKSLIAKFNFLINTKDIYGIKMFKFLIENAFFSFLQQKISKVKVLYILRSNGSR